MCVEYETKRVDICCRVNADEPGKESTAVEYLWAQLSGLIIVVEQFLQAWPGLFYKVRQADLPNLPICAKETDERLHRRLTPHAFCKFL